MPEKTAVARSPGELAYIEDVRRCPTYHDGTPRHAWSDLPEWAQWSWEKNPTPRSCGHVKRKVDADG